MATGLQMSMPSTAYHDQTKLLDIKTTTLDQGRIPVVGHVITDEAIGSLQGTRVQAINLNKVIKLLTDEHSLMLFDRHLHALKKLCKHYKDGFIMKDLVGVFKILNLCADRVDQHPIYITPMIDILKICSLPFLKEKSSDETAYEQIAVESVAQLGYLMRVPSDEVRLQVCETIIKFYDEAPPVQLVQRHQANTQAYNQKIVERSDIAETLVKSLALLENDVNIKIAVLNVLQRLSKTSSSNCNMMLRADGAQRLCSRLMDYDPSGQVLFRSVDILWNLLDNGSHEEVAVQLNNFSCVSQLRDAFIQQLTQGYSHYDRQLRNDLLVLASIIATVCIEAPFVETGFIKQITLFSTFQEVKSHNALVKHLKLMTNHEDFELKKLLINMLVICSQDPAVIPILSEGKLLLALFSFVKANEKTSQPQEWTVAQFEEIQLHAMSALCTLGPLMIEDYMTCQGSTRSLLLLEWCVGPADDYHGTGNSFHGAGGRDNKKAQMRHCLRLIRSMISTGDESVLQDFTDQGAINQLITILSKILAHRKKIETAVDIEMQCDMLFILSSICENDVHRKELFGNQGVDVVVEFLKTDVTKLDSGLGHHRLLLAAVDCVWCAVVGCFTTEDYFLEREGVFHLIDLLANCPKNMHNLVLGCLLDLCENPKTTAHVNSWRGKDDISAAHLLCVIWRDEERDMGVARENNGAMSDTKRPLVGQLQDNTGTIALPANHASSAIVDVSENMRAKLYALFCKLGFIELPGLTTEDHVTLTIIEHYLEFKLGEVWKEVMSELEHENIRPITPDREALEAVSRTVNDRAEHVCQVQKELIDAQHQQNIIDEQENYAEIRENHRQKEKALKDFSDFVARTSHYALLKAARERQELSIDASRVATNYKQSDTFHSTDLPNLMSTIRSKDSSQKRRYRYVPNHGELLRYTGGLPMNITMKNKHHSNEPIKEPITSQAPSQSSSRSNQSTDTAFTPPNSEASTLDRASMSSQFSENSSYMKGVQSVPSSFDEDYFMSLSRGTCITLYDTDSDVSTQSSTPDTLVPNNSRTLLSPTDDSSDTSENKMDAGTVTTPSGCGGKENECFSYEGLEPCSFRALNASQSMNESIFAGTADGIEMRRFSALCDDYLSDRLAGLLELMKNEEDSENSNNNTSILQSQMQLLEEMRLTENEISELQFMRVSDRFVSSYPRLTQICEDEGEATEIAERRPMNRMEHHQDVDIITNQVQQCDDSGYNTNQHNNHTDNNQPMAKADSHRPIKRQSRVTSLNGSANGNSVLNLSDSSDDEDINSILNNNEKHKRGFERKNRNFPSFEKIANENDVSSSGKGFSSKWGTDPKMNDIKYECTGPWYRRHASMEISTSSSDESSTENSTDELDSEIDSNCDGLSSDDSFEFDLDPDFDRNIERFTTNKDTTKFGQTAAYKYVSPNIKQFTENYVGTKEDLTPFGHTSKYGEISPRIRKYTDDYTSSKDTNNFKHTEKYRKVSRKCRKFTEKFWDSWDKQPDVSEILSVKRKKMRKPHRKSKRCKNDIADTLVDHFKGKDHSHQHDNDLDQTCDPGLFEEPKKCPSMHTVDMMIERQIRKWYEHSVDGSDSLSSATGSDVSLDDISSEQSNKKLSYHTIDKMIERKIREHFERVVSKDDDGAKGRFKSPRSIGTKPSVNLTESETESMGITSSGYSQLVTESTPTSTELKTTTTDFTSFGDLTTTESSPWSYITTSAAMSVSEVLEDCKTVTTAMSDIVNHICGPTLSMNAAEIDKKAEEIAHWLVDENIRVRQNKESEELLQGGIVKLLCFDKRQELKEEDSPRKHQGINEEGKGNDKIPSKDNESRQSANNESITTNEENITTHEEDKATKLENSPTYKSYLNTQTVEHNNNKPGKESSTVKIQQDVAPLNEDIHTSVPKLSNIDIMLQRDEEIMKINKQLMKDVEDILNCTDKEKLLTEANSTEARDYLRQILDTSNFEAIEHLEAALSDKSLAGERLWGVLFLKRAQKLQTMWENVFTESTEMKIERKITDEVGEETKSCDVKEQDMMSYDVNENESSIKEMEKSRSNISASPEKQPIDPDEEQSNPHEKDTESEAKFSDVLDQPAQDINAQQPDDKPEETMSELTLKRNDTYIIKSGKKSNEPSQDLTQTTERSSSENSNETKSDQELNHSTYIMPSYGSTSSTASPPRLNQRFSSISNKRTNHSQMPNEGSNHSPVSNQRSNHSPEFDPRSNHSLVLIQRSNHSPVSNQRSNHSPMSNQRSNHSPVSNQRSNHSPEFDLRSSSVYSAAAKHRGSMLRPSQVEFSFNIDAILDDATTEALRRPLTSSKSDGHLVVCQSTLAERYYRMQHSVGFSENWLAIKGEKEGGSSGPEMRKKSSSESDVSVLLIYANQDDNGGSYANEDNYANGPRVTDIHEIEMDVNDQLNGHSNEENQSVNNSSVNNNGIDYDFYESDNFNFNANNNNNSGERLVKKTRAKSNDRSKRCKQVFIKLEDEQTKVEFEHTKNTKSSAQGKVNKEVSNKKKTKSDKKESMDISEASDIEEELMELDNDFSDSKTDVAQNERPRCKTEIRNKCQNWLAALPDDLPNDSRFIRNSNSSSHSGINQAVNQKQNGAGATPEVNFLSATSALNPLNFLSTTKNQDGGSNMAPPSPDGYYRSQTRFLEGRMELLERTDVASPFLDEEEKAFCRATESDINFDNQLFEQGRAVLYPHIYPASARLIKQDKKATADKITDPSKTEKKRESSAVSNATKTKFDESSPLLQKSYQLMVKKNKEFSQRLQREKEEREKQEEDKKKPKPKSIDMTIKGKSASRVKSSGPNVARRKGQKLVSGAAGKMQHGASLPQMTRCGGSGKATARNHANKAVQKPDNRNDGNFEGGYGKQRNRCQAFERNANSLTSYQTSSSGQNEFSFGNNNKCTLEEAFEEIKLDDEFSESSDLDVELTPNGHSSLPRVPGHFKFEHKTSFRSINLK